MGIPRLGRQVVFADGRRRQEPRAKSQEQEASEEGGDDDNDGSCTLAGAAKPRVMLPKSQGFHS